MPASGSTRQNDEVSKRSIVNLSSFTSHLIFRFSLTRLLLFYHNLYHYCVRESFFQNYLTPEVILYLLTFHLWGKSLGKLQNTPKAPFF